MLGYRMGITLCVAFVPAGCNGCKSYALNPNRRVEKREEKRHKSVEKKNITLPPG